MSRVREFLVSMIRMIAWLLNGESGMLPAFATTLAGHAETVQSDTTIGLEIASDRRTSGVVVARCEQQAVPPVAPLRSRK